MHPTVEPEDAPEELPTSFLWMEPPDHTRLRNLVTKGFTPRTVARLRPRIEKLSEELVDKALEAGEFDLVEMIAYPLPLIIACELIGVPEEAYEQVHQWSQDLARGFDHDYTLPEESLKARSAASRGFMGYFRELLNERRVNPRDDLLSALSQVEDRGDMLTEQELLATCISTFVAGHETTDNLIGAGMLRLLRSPDQVQAMRDRPDLTASAPDELLRLEPSVQITTRPITVAGHDFEPGEGVVVLINSANHDERSSPTRTAPTSPATPTPCTPPRSTWASASASTTAWAPPWPCWRWRSCSTCCCAKSVRWSCFRRIHRSSRTW